MSSSSYSRRGSISTRRSSRSTRTPSIQHPSSLSQSYTQPSPRLSGASLHSPEFWSHLYAQVPPPVARTPAPGLQPDNLPAPAAAPRAPPRRAQRKRGPFCISDSKSESESGEEEESLRRIRNTLQSSRPPRVIESEEESEDSVDEWHPEEGSEEEPEVESEYPQEESEEDDMTAMGQRASAIVSNKRDSSPSRNMVTERPSKMVKKDYGSSSSSDDVRPARGASLTTPIDLSSDSEDEPPLAHPFSRRDQTQPQAPVQAKESPRRTKERVPANEFPRRTSYYAGLGRASIIREPRRSSPLSMLHKDMLREDSDLVPSPIPTGPDAQFVPYDHDPFRQSFAGYKSPYQQNVTEYEEATKRVQELENELARTKKDLQSQIGIIREENEMLRREKDHADQDHESTVDTLRSEYEDKLQQAEQERKSQKLGLDFKLQQANQDRDSQQLGLDVQLQKAKREHDAKIAKMRQESKKNLDEIQQANAEEARKSIDKITALEKENDSLKGQLEEAKTAHDELAKSMGRREVIVDTEYTFKALQAKNAALQKEIENLKKCQANTSRQSAPPPLPLGPLSPTPPTPAPSSLSHAPSEETKSSNIRSVYVKIRRKYDSLMTIAKLLLDDTTNMDLAAFGAFGMHVKQLNKVLADNQENDDNAGGASQQSQSQSQSQSQPDGRSGVGSQSQQDGRSERNA